jgi:hypothetical protein
MNVDGQRFSFLTLPLMAFANGVSNYFLGGWAELGTPQQQADDVVIIRSLAASGVAANQIDANVRRFGFQPQNTGELRVLDEAQSRVTSKYDECRSRVFGNAQTFAQRGIIGREEAVLALFGGGLGTDRTAMLAGIWAHESNFKQRPDGDAGPAQLTSWWRNNRPELVVGNAMEPGTVELRGCLLTGMSRIIWPPSVTSFGFRGIAMEMIEI